MGICDVLRHHRATFSPESPTAPVCLLTEAFIEFGEAEGFVGEC